MDKKTRSAVDFNERRDYGRSYLESLGCNWFQFGHVTRGKNSSWGWRECETEAINALTLLLSRKGYTVTDNNALKEQYGDTDCYARKGPNVYTFDTKKCSYSGYGVAVPLSTKQLNKLVHGRQRFILVYAEPFNDTRKFSFVELTRNLEPLNRTNGSLVYSECFKITTVVDEVVVKQSSKKLKRIQDEE